MILNFQNEINVIMYIIEFLKKSKLKSFHLNKITITYEIFKVYVFVMFRMKYLINKIYNNILSQQGGWLDDKGVCPNPKVKGSNLMNGVLCG
jgi:hypothetical protein